MPEFTPPSQNVIPPITPDDPDPLMRHFRSRPAGINVFYYSDGTITETHPDGTQRFWAKGDGSPYVATAFYGGASYTVTEAVAALLEAAGYAVVDDEPDQPPTPEAPAILSLSPSSGESGVAVVMLGTSLTAATAVTFDGTSVAFTVVSAGRIDTHAATHAAGAVDVIVTTPLGASDPFTFTYEGAPEEPPVTADGVLLATGDQLLLASGDPLLLEA